MLRKGLLGLALVAGVAASPACAGMVLDAATPGADPAPTIQEAQFVVDAPFPFPVGLFFFGGHDGCWYDDGWRGPGWYWCGYGYRQGYGWFGGEGFNGWHQHRYERDWHGGHGGGEHHAGGGDHHHEGGGGGGGGHGSGGGGGGGGHGGGHGGGGHDEHNHP